MTKDELYEICREELKANHLLCDFSDGSIDKVIRVVLRVVSNRINAAEMLNESEKVAVRTVFNEIREALCL